MFELAMNPDIQAKLREEIMTGLESNNGKVSYEMLHEFKYLHKVIQESLRKYPPIPNTQRRCTKDYQIPNTTLTIQKGTSIQFNMYSIHRDPEYYPEPEKFDPERFSDENIKARHPMAFIPFGDGPRNCIGIR
jgi:cytochrome P450 family 6